jgi:S1-C subfamily serine protease
MDTAGSPNWQFQTSDGYAIPINRARSIVTQIVSGKASATVHVGATAFLGISAASSGTPGAVVASVVPGSAAAAAGLEPGDLITAVDRTKIASPAAVTRIIMTKKPGTTLTIAYVDTSGTSRTVRVKLGSGPPQ